MTSKFTMGTDPEFVLVDKTIMRATSAHGLIPGTKDKPFKVDGGAIQVDGTMVEFNIDPASTADEFVTNTNKVLNHLETKLGDKYAFSFRPTVFYEPMYFDTLPEESRELGCSPDFNAFKEGGINQRPEPGRDKVTMRTCSGHIHIGWTSGKDPDDPSHRWDCCFLIQALENTVGPYLKLWDDDTLRQELYGKPGAFRPKPYGVEWRTPSNAWLNHPKLWPWLFDAIKSVFEQVQNGTFRHVVWGEIDDTRSKRDLAHQLGRYTYQIFPKIDEKYFDNSIAPLKGVSVAASSGSVTYDLDLDLMGKSGGGHSYKSLNKKTVLPRDAVIL